MLRLIRKSINISGKIKIGRPWVIGINFTRLFNNKKGGHPMNYMGIDVHSGSCEFAVINESGNVLEQSSFQTSLENLIEVAEKVKKPLNIVFEEGELAGWLYRGLLGYADDIVVADPVHNRLIYGSDQKSDKLDPVKLANLLRGGFINRVHTI